VKLPTSITVSSERIIREHVKKTYPPHTPSGRKLVNHEKKCREGSAFWGKGSAEMFLGVAEIFSSWPLGGRTTLPRLVGLVKRRRGVPRMGAKFQEIGPTKA